MQRFGRRETREIDLVDDDGQRSLGRRGRARSGERSRQRLAHVGNPQQEIGSRDLEPRAAHAFALDGIARGSRNPAVSTTVTGKPSSVRCSRKRIARGAGNLRDDCRVVTCETIQQARLAGVRRAGDRDAETVAQRSARHGARAQRVERRDDVVELGDALGRCVERQFLVGKVEPRLDADA